MSIDTSKLDYANKVIAGIKAGDRLIVIPSHYSQAEKDWLIGYVNEQTKPLNLNVNETPNTQ